MAFKASGNSFDPLIDEHSKLIVMEQNLIAVLQKIDNELNQTDVEWMHLKSLVEPRKEAEKKIIDTPKNISTEPAVKKEHHNIDDQIVNATQLDLSLGTSDKHMASDEEESD